MPFGSNSDKNSDSNGCPPPIDAIPSTISMTSRQRRLSMNFIRTPTRRSSGGGMIRFQGHRVTLDLGSDATDLQQQQQQPQQEDLLEGGSVSMGSILSIDTTGAGGTGTGSILSMEESGVGGQETRTRRVLSSIFCCLKRSSSSSSSSLRSQILIRFGSLSCLLIVVFVLTAIFSTILHSRDTVLNMMMVHLGEDVYLQHCRLQAVLWGRDILHQRLQQLDGALRLIDQMTHERFATSSSSTTIDSEVPPTYDVYPWKATSKLPLSSSTQQVTATRGDVQQHGRGNHDRRSSWYEVPINTTTAMMISSSSSSLLRKNKSVLFDLIHSKVSDYATPLLKSLYEYHDSIKTLAIHFINDGHGGATVEYPSTTHHFNMTSMSSSSLLVNSTKYKSGIGCDWLRLPNPRTTTTRTHRHRRELGSSVQRAYCQEAGPSSILQQDWCRQQALYPDTFQFDANGDENVGYLVRMGKAIYDTNTHELLACTTITMNAASLLPFMNETPEQPPSPQQQQKQLFVINWSDDAILSGSQQLESQTDVNDLDIGLNKDVLRQMKRDFVARYRTNRTVQPASYQTNEWYASVYPSPPPPPLNSSTGVFWRPHLLVVAALRVSTARESHLEKLRQNLEPRTNRLIRNVLLAGFTSMVVLLNIVFVVSLFLTAPLNWMHAAGKYILESAVGSSHNYTSDAITTMSYNEDLDMEHEHRWWYKISPHTEVIQLADEFHKMVEQFSGNGTAKLFKQQLLEVKNPFTLYGNFKKLYERRKQSRLSYDYSIGVNHHHHHHDNGNGNKQEQSTQKTSDVDVDAPSSPTSLLSEQRLAMSSFVQSSPSKRIISEFRLHMGPNVRNIGTQEDLDESIDNLNTEDVLTTEGSDAVTTSNEQQTGWKRFVPRKGSMVLKSSLFRWIVGAVAVPLILVMICISVCVLVDIDRTLPTLVDVARDVYTDLERDFLVPLVRLRALYVAEVLQTSLRDLYLLNRMAGWLMTGAITMNNESFTTTATLSMAADACKEYSPSTSCPQYEQLLSTCDCSWSDPWGVGCNANTTNQRRNQVISFEALSEDAFPNGDRNFTSFPSVGTTPNHTQWWPNIESLPGYTTTTTNNNNNNNITAPPDVDTTFGRARIATALSPIQIPLYNYVVGSNGLTRTWGSYLAFDKAGSYSGYAGCNFLHAFYAMNQFGADTESFNQELCPNGKYGLDPRCLEWYVKGRDKAYDMNKDPLVVTRPSRQPFSDAYPQASLALPLIDTRTGEFLGETMVRFSTEKIREILSEKETSVGLGGFHLMTFAGGEAANNKGVFIGPENGGHGDNAKSVTDLILPADECDLSTTTTTTGNCDDFNKIAADMHAGGAALASFQRTSNTTGETETVSIAYAPVRIKSYRPINPSDFSSGVREYQSDVFSIALGKPEETLGSEFESIEADLREELRGDVWTLLVVALVATSILLPISAWITISITVPLSELCQLVSDLNRHDTNAEFPKIRGGPSEVTRVRSTFERLFKVIRVGNVAFFMGELETAYSTLHDAFVLFTRLGNRKAIGIANNNLGNVMLTMYRAMKKTNSPVMCRFSRKKVIHKGCVYFKAAIDRGERALRRIYEKEGFSMNYLIFMQQVSNRYFNRGIFLLTVRTDHAKPELAESQGMTDLVTCKDMDREVVDNGDHEGFKGDLDVYFELLMSRIKGLLLLMKMGYEDPWGIEDLFDEARSALVSGLSMPGHPLFDDLEQAGQMQRLDSALIEYHLHMTGRANIDEERKNTHVRKAAAIGIRMMIEDDYIIGEAGMLALKALIDSTHLANADEYGEDPSDVRTKLFQYRHRIGEILSLTYSSRDICSRECFNASNLGDFSMEVF